MRQRLPHAVVQLCWGILPERVCSAPHALLFRYVWESNASGGFAISEDTQGEPLGRGTQIKLFLKVTRLLLCKITSSLLI